MTSYLGSRAEKCTFHDGPTAWEKFSGKFEFMASVATKEKKTKKSYEIDIYLYTSVHISRVDFAHF